MWKKGISLAGALLLVFGLGASALAAGAAQAPGAPAPGSAAAMAAPAPGQPLRAPVPVTGVAITTAPAGNSMNVGQTFALGITVTPATATDKTVTWQSSDTAVLDVDANGSLTAKKAGTATITATARDGSGVSGQVAITVVQATVPVTGVTITTFPKDQKLAYGDTFTLKADVQPANADKKTLTWSSGNTGVITVDSSTGKITAKGVGKATVTAASTDGSGVKGTIEVEVTARAVKVAGITAQNRGYDGTTTATLLTDKATFDGVLSGDTLTVSGTGTFATAQPGTGILVTLSGLKLGGDKAANYAVDTAGSQTTTVADIAKRQVSISTPGIVTQKVYDGTTAVEVKPGTPSNILAADEGDVRVTATAVYDDAEVGTGKTITVTYKLEGAKAGWYLPPPNYVTRNGQILPDDAAEAPANLTQASITAQAGTSITLSGVQGQMYALVSGEKYGYYQGGKFTEGWIRAQQDGQAIVFSGLQANKTYRVVTRKIYDEKHETPSLISQPLEVMLYSLAQKQVLDGLEPLKSGITTPGQVQALVSVAQSYNSLPEEELATLEAQSQVSVTMESLRAQAAAINHTSEGVTVDGDTLPWYVQLTVTPVDAQSPAWQQFARHSGVREVLQAATYTLTDLTTGTAWNPAENPGVRFSAPMLRQDDLEALEVLYLTSEGGVATFTYQVQNGNIFFTGDGAGTYALALVGEGGAAAEQQGISARFILVLILALVLVACGALLVLYFVKWRKVE